MNKVQLIGRLTKDPEIKYAPGSGNAYCRFTLAVNKDFKNQEGKYDADFINCLAFGKRAETITQYVTKGNQFAVTGRIQTGSYDAQDGTKRYTFEVLVDGFDFIGSNNNNQVSDQFRQPADQPQQSSYDPSMTPVDDGDLPF